MAGVKIRIYIFPSREAAEKYIERSSGQPGYSECYHTGPRAEVNAHGETVWKVTTTTYYG